jgi:pimeloyl-ACP methyl ester carboxylesterase
MEMEHAMKSCNRIVVWGMVIILGSLLVLSTVAVKAHPSLQSPPDPQPDPPWLTSICYGAVPPQNPDGPVLVFVHGYGGVADNWWTALPYGELNDMYAMAYQDGYRTAFVSLGGPDGSETGSMWDNGQLLSWQLGVIASHYGVDSLDIVAHSKGGVDAQAAAAHYGGFQLVRHVFTLGSPHQGSELADLLYSDWASWLARLLGLQDGATYTLQTGYMQVFRALTDSKVAEQDVIYYRAAGTDTGPQFSGLWLMGLYLSLFGPNDGAVTVASTELPGAHTLFIQPYDHYSIFLGHTAFPWIDAALNGEEPNHHQLYLPLVTTDATSEPPSDSEVILRGGVISGTVTETVPIESGALEVTFDLMVPSDTVTATLTAPDALPRPLEVIPPSGDWLFGRVWHLVYTEDDPVAGEWVFTINSPEESAYLLVATVKSPLEVALRGWPDGTMRPGDPLSFEVQASHPAGQPLVRRVEGRVTRALPGGVLSLSKAHLPDTPMLLTTNGGVAVAHLPSQEGIYVISATVTGETPEGTPFERAFVCSLAVVKPETLHGGPTLLDE